MVRIIHNCACIGLCLFFMQSCAATKEPTPCSCGFYDASTNNIFTESTIVYFNETDQIPSEQLVVQSFEHKSDRGWNTLYRKGASFSNIEIKNDTTARNVQSLALYCDPSDPAHLVVGASMRTARQDLFYGSFRTTMRSPRKWFRGSVLSMILDHNMTESWNMNLMNTDNHDYAWVSMLARGVFPNLWLGVNYTTLESESIQPWFYTDYRVDWTPESIDYYIGGKLQKSMTRKVNGTLPSTPSAMLWQHWSTGDRYASQGPPLERGEANILALRLFFNSSTMTAEEHAAFDDRCEPSLACSMEDWSLRGSSPISEASRKKWVQQNPSYKIHWIPVSIDIVFGCLSILLLARTLSKRSSFSKIFQKLTSRSKRVSKMDRAGSKTDSLQSSIIDVPTHHFDVPPSLQLSGMSTPTLIGSGSMQTLGVSTPTVVWGNSTPMQSFHTSGASRSDLHDQWSGSSTPSVLEPSQASTKPVAESYPGHNPWTNHVLRASDIENPFLSDEEKHAIEYLMEPNRQVGPSDPIEPVAPGRPSPVLISPSTQLLTIREENKSGVELTVVQATPAGAQVATGGTIATKRVDYLAGFIAISAFLVTMNHFVLTFASAVIIPGDDPHYHSEVVARKTIASYFLDGLWIGPFLMISTRFLVSGYLRNGKLDAMAQKIATRPFRLLIPVAFIAVLEYFFMDLGAVNYLEYLASVTWSSWPYTVIPTDAGTFISQLLQLAYLIPNAAPQIVYYYCTGVLWTIPVQLQGAWQTVLAVIMVREMKTPWKRFAFYTFCILNHWYALSWGSYYYSGVLLADLDITYKYTKWLHARPLIYYPVLIFVILVAQAGFTIDMVTQHTGVEYAAIEYGWHPDPSSGLLISQVDEATYPDFFIPRLNALISTVFMQLIVEICPSVQKFLSLKPFQWIFPHTFTIYLIHGYIFWSIGSALCIGLFAIGVPYWACVLIVFVSCYGTLIASLPLLTPIIEIVGKGVTQSLWEHASQEPAPKEKTLYPFGEEIFGEPEEVIPEKDVEISDHGDFAEKERYNDGGGTTGIKVDRL